MCINSLKELLFIGDESILDDISYQESPYQLTTFEFPVKPKNCIVLYINYIFFNIFINIFFFKFFIFF